MEGLSRTEAVQESAQKEAVAKEAAQGTPPRNGTE
jgi:hypothetical protein